MQNQLGEYLQNLRIQSDLTLNSISKKTKVRSHFLEQIERNKIIKMPRIIVQSYVFNFGKTVKADQEILLEKFNQLYEEEKTPSKVKLPKKKTVSALFIWSIVLILLALSIGLTISSKNQSVIQTAEFKVPTEQNNKEINYSSPRNLEELLISSPNPSFDNNK